MSWARWFDMKLYWWAATNEGHDIGLTAEFQSDWDSIPGCCKFKAGLVGGELSLEPQTGRIPLQPRWPHAGTLDHDPTRGYRIELTDSETLPQWRIESPVTRLIAHKTFCLEGRLDQSCFARLTSYGQSSSVTATYRVELRHIKIMRVDWKTAFPKAHSASLTDKQRKVLEAKLRRHLYDKLGQVVGKTKITQPG